MFGFINKIFIVLLTSLVNASNDAKCVSLSNQKCEIQPTLINFYLMNAAKNYTIIHLQLN